MAKDKYEKIDNAIDPQEQERQPGFENQMDPEPIYDDPDYKGADKL